MKRIFISLGVYLTWALTGWAATQVPATTIDAIARLSPSEASQQRQVSFEAVVTYFRPYDHVMFVEDGPAAMFVSATTDLKLVPGDRVLIRGTTHDSFRNYVQSNDITLLRHETLPLPIQTSYREMIRGEADCRLVRVRAVIRSAEVVPSSTLLIPATAFRMLVDGEQVDAEVGGSDAAALRGLLDAEVEITGVVSGHFDNKMQQTGILLHVESLDDVRVLQRSGVDPWSIPVTPMDRVITGYSILDQTQRTRVHGTITYYLPGSGAVLQDGSRSLWITTDSFLPLKVGDLADATGFPDVKDGFLSLTRSEIRDSSVYAPVAAPLYTWRTLAEGGNSSHGHLYDLVSIEGQVVAEVRQATQDEYILMTDGHLTSAILRHPGSFTPTPRPTMRQVPIGAKVRVTGICMLVDADPFMGDVPFNLLLRSYDDIAVVAPPPWLDVRHLIFLVTILVGTMFALVARSWRIERRVRRQTSSLAEVEGRRSRVLEAMNANEPIEEILTQVCDLVSVQLNEAPCWCEMTDGPLTGHIPAMPLKGRKVQRCAIAAPSGSALGTLFALSTVSSEKTDEVLSRAAELILLATEKARLHSDLVHRSEFDLLTEIHNRFSIEKCLDAKIDEAHESGAIFGLIYVDLDGFKDVNDKYGHGVGDQYLQAVALRMSRQLRISDLLARLGGDEFAVLVSEVQNRAEVDQIASRLMRCFDDPFAISETVIPGGASIGVALYPADGTDKDSLFNVADAAMYAQKRARKQLPIDSACV